MNGKYTIPKEFHDKRITEQIKKTLTKTDDGYVGTDTIPTTFTGENPFYRDSVGTGELN